MLITFTSSADGTISGGKVLSDYDIWSKRLEDGTINHVMRVYLVDSNDRIREIYNTAFLQPELVVRDIEMILIEK
jgi:hypothetical protein